MLIDISRPCRFIQMLCQPSIDTAIRSTSALKISWPMPEAAEAIAPAKIATTTAPAPPPAIPFATHMARPATPRVAARTMPMISAASSTSRNTITAVASMCGPLLGDDAPLGSLFVVFADKLVSASFERADRQRCLAVARDDFLALQIVAFKLLGRRIEVLHHQLDLLAGGHLEFLRVKLVILDGEDEDVLVLSMRGNHAGDAQRYEKGGKRARDIHVGLEGCNGLNDSHSHSHRQALFEAQPRVS